MEMTAYRNKDAEKEVDAVDEEAVTMPNDNECSLLHVEEKLVDYSVLMSKNSNRCKIPVIINDDGIEVTDPESIVHKQLASPEELMEYVSALMNEDDAYDQFEEDVKEGKKRVNECGSVTVHLRREGLSCKRQIYAASCGTVSIY